MKKFVFSILSLLIAVNIAQANDFKVLSKSGKSAIKSGKSWNDIKVGNMLKSNDQIKLENKAYLVLMYIKNKRTIELKTAGSFDLKKISTELNKKGNINAKLAKYFVEELSSTDDFFKKNNYKDGMEGNLAAVERGIGFPTNTDSKVSDLTKMNASDSKTISNLAGAILGSDTKMIFTKFPKTSYILEPVTDFVWFKYEKSNKYTLIVYDKTGKEYFKKSVEDTVLRIDLKSIQLLPGVNYYWRVESGNVSSLEECIVLLNENKALEVQNVINELMEDSDANSPMTNIAIASYLADCNITVSAYKYFKAALDLAPESDEYKRSFAKFLIRIGNYEEAKGIFR